MRGLRFDFFFFRTLIEMRDREQKRVKKNEVIARVILYLFIAVKQFRIK